MTDDGPQRPHQVPTEQIPTLMAEAEVKQTRYAAQRARCMAAALAADAARQERVEREAAARANPTASEAPSNANS